MRREREDGSEVAVPERVSNRRRSQRFICLAPADAAARVTFDGVIESWQHDRVVVTTGHAATLGDQFVMQLRASSGHVTTWAVGVLACEPPIGETAPHYRVTLKASPVPPSWDEPDAPGA